MPIDIGSAAIDRAADYGNDWMMLSLENPANKSGLITDVAIYAQTSVGEKWKVGTFYGTAPNFTCRDSVELTMDSGLNNFSGLSINVQAGDYIGIFVKFPGRLEIDTEGGSGCYVKAGDQTETGQQTYILESGYTTSVYGTGPLVKVGEVSIVAVAAVQGAAKVVCAGEAVIGSTSSLIVLAEGIYSVELSLQSIAALSILPTRVFSGKVSIQSESNLFLIMTRTGSGKAALTAQGVLSPSLVSLAIGQVSLEAAGVSAPTLILCAVGQSAFTAQSAITLIFSKPFAAALEAAGVLIGDLSVIAGGHSSISAAAVLLPDMASIVVGRAPIIAAGTLVVGTSLVGIAQAALAAVGAMDVAVNYIRIGCIALTATGTLDVAATSVIAGNAVLTAEGTLTYAGLAFVTKQLVYSGTLQPGDVLVIDTDDMTVKLNGANVTMYFTGDFFELFVGDNEIEYVDHEGSRTALVSIDHSDKWI